MGTTADFYVGCGENAEWLGSVATDGSEWAMFPRYPLNKATTEKAFRKAVADIFAESEEDEYATAETGCFWLELIWLTKKNVRLTYLQKSWRGILL